MPLFTDFDPEEGLISPGFEKLGLALPEYAVMAFLSERPSGIFSPSPKRTKDTRQGNSCR